MGRGSGGGGRIRASGSYITVSGTTISTRFDVGGARLVATSRQRDTQQILGRFSPAVLRRARTGLLSDGNTSAVARIDRALARRR